MDAEASSVHAHRVAGVNHSSHRRMTYGRLNGAEKLDISVDTSYHVSKAQLHQSSRRRSRLGSHPLTTTGGVRAPGPPSSQHRSPRARIVIAAMRLWQATLAPNDVLTFGGTNLPRALFVVLAIEGTHLVTAHTSPSCCFRLRGNPVDEGAGDSKVAAANCRKLNMGDYMRATRSSISKSRSTDVFQ
ncbi:hypothetical protein AB1N83_010056 [Pleurotus pulmonarius]